MEIKIGNLVVHPTRPEWGPGKVLRIEGDRLHIIWRDVPGREAKTMRTSVVALQLAPVQSDDTLDNLPPVVEEGGCLVLPTERVTFQQTLAKFLARYPGGFFDHGYLGDAKSGEREYKWAAHEGFLKRLGGGRFRELLNRDRAALIQEVLWCFRTLNVLSPYEKAAVSDALKDVSALDNFLQRLCDLLEAERVDESVFKPYAAAISDLPADRGRVATWPVATIIPFIAQPDRHLLLKPELTIRAAEALGFNLNYSPTPNWLTYSRLLEMAQIYWRKLESLKPRDLIDVQSFLWVACG